ncbi:hypothetical protein SANA_17740 [Gottschalkiaceae bacterium SANA]|nr:hypothetical protein SANA_17740 [Gottschalkiaceae bacterium SANA]
MKKNDGFTLIELLVTLVIVGVIMTFIISMMSSQYAIIRDVDAYLVLSAENKDVNDRIIQEFVKAERILVNDVDMTDTTFPSTNFNKDINLETIKLKYENDTSNDIDEIATISFEKNDNELVMKKVVGSDTTNPSIAKHLANIDPVVTFYKRLSQDRRVVSLVKVKINYLHDGITKQYDLFYHLRNLQFN